MSDHFEKAMQNIALQTAKNGGPQIGDVLTALVATNEDLDNNHKATLTLIDKHIKDESARAKRLARNLRIWQKKQSDECLARHADWPRREDDESEESYIERRGRSDLEKHTWLMWMITTWIGRIVATVIGGGVLTLMNMFGEYLAHHIHIG